MVQTKIKTLVITGPTAVGKSDAAVTAALQLDGEVISADSMQIYKGMDIGTGKIKPSEMCGVPHYMIDVASPDEDYSVGRYVFEARAAVEDVARRGKLPIIVGGTGLYINSLLLSHSFAGTPKNEQIRSSLKQFAAENGADALHARLKEVDPISAQTIMASDVKRVIRALEIFYSAGKPKSELSDEATEPVYDYKLIVLSDDREELYDRINKRVDKMIECGLVDEVKKLYKYKDCNSMQAIGYKEIIAYLEGSSTLTDAVEIVKQSSRRYAKRQMTFFRGMKLNKVFLSASDSSKISNIFREEL